MSYKRLLLKLSTSFFLLKSFGSGIFILFLMSGRPLYAQRTCGTPQAIKDATILYPVKAKMYFRKQSRPTASLNIQQFLRGKPVAVIPVVVHIVLKNPDAVTDAQVQSQINVLNLDYNAENDDSSRTPAVWKSLFGDMKIQFCLAERTPDGNPSNGIERIKTGVTEFSILNAVAGVKHTSSGGANAWDTKKYLNIWVCNLGNGTLGIGTPPGLYPDDEDGIVVQYDAFGDIGNLQPAYNKGRTCTHETGHYFNLLHPWGDGDGTCSPGDYIADTPPESGPVSGCPAFPYLEDHCSPDPPGVMVPNFMGYANDSCMSLFTNGQVARAQAALFNAHASLLSSDGCQPVILKQLDAKIQNILSPNNKQCDNTIAPVISLKNMGTETLKKVNIQYRLNDGIVKSYAWTGSLVSLDTTVIALPASSLQTGNYHLTAYTSEPNGHSDEQTDNDTARTFFHLDPLATTPFSEGFESDSFPPPGWEIHNPDRSYTWEKTKVAAHSGRYSIVMKNLDYEQNGPVDDLVTPVFDTPNADSVFLFFYVAAGVQSNPNGNNAYWDTLQVLISNDCAVSGISVYKKWGKSLITDSIPTAQEFVPNARQWRRDSINLTPYLKNGKFQIIFRNITNFENNIYLDDIHIITKQTNPILEKEKVLVVPNPTTGRLSVQFLQIPPQLKAVAVYNTLGQLIFRKAATAANAGNRIEFNLANEPNGVYFVRIFYTDHTVIKKIVKIK